MNAPFDDLKRRIAEAEQRRKEGKLSPADLIESLRESARRRRGCLSAETIASLIELRLRSFLDVASWAHLASCSLCRAEVAALWPSAASARQPALRHIAVVAPIAASVVVAAILGFLHVRSRSAPNILVTQTNSAPPTVGAEVPPPALLAMRGPGEGPGQRVAVVVGINHYSPVSGLRPLHGAVNDAKRMSALLDKAGYVVFELTPGGPPDREPTRANILQTLSLLPNSAKGGTLVLYWSGHGLADGEAYLMPSDATANAKLSGLSFSDIRKVIAETGLDFRWLALIADVCKVGANDPVPGFVENLSKYSNDWVIITSAGKGEPAFEILWPTAKGIQVPEAKEPHGLFTFYLLTARYRVIEKDGQLLSPADANADGFLSWREAYDYAAARTQQGLVRGEQGRGVGRLLQSPQILTSRPAFETNIFLVTEPVPRFSPSGGIRPDQVVLPALDPVGRFVVYEEMTEETALPFVPYGWMWGTRKNEELAPQLVTQMMQLDLESKEKPLGGTGTCVRWQVIWSGQIKDRSWNATWAAIGWFAGPDSPTWFAAPGDNRGLYFNLESPRRFRVLKFSARSPNPGTRLQAKVGVLSRDKEKKPLPLGDSLAWPIASRWVELKREWVEFQVELKPYQEQELHDCDTNRDESGICWKCGDSPLVRKHNNLERICSLAFMVERFGPNGQPNPAAPVEIYLDQIFFE